jgi:hypothetical protein
MPFTHQTGESKQLAKIAAQDVLDTSGQTFSCVFKLKQLTKVN